MCAYRPNVCILLFRDRGDVFVGKRSDAEGYWQFPQGGIDPGQSAIEAVMEEIYEETGIDRTQLSIVGVMDKLVAYDFDQPREYFGNVFNGQKQSFWFVKFLGKDEYINLSKRQPAEFVDYKWVPIGEVKDIIDSRKYGVCEEAINTLKTAINFSNT